MSVSLSPIYEHFSETLSGLSTIRALRDTARFTEENEVKLDDSQRANFAGRLHYIFQWVEKWPQYMPHSIRALND